MRGLGSAAPERGHKPPMCNRARAPVLLAMGLGLEILVILLLIVLNGLFSLSELALVSARRARLAVLERKGVAGAAAARRLAEDPQRFLPTVQVGITLVSVLTGVFGGARIAAHLQDLAGGVPASGAGSPRRCRWPWSWS